MCSGKVYSKEEARSQFDIIYQQLLDDSTKIIEDKLKTYDVFVLVFSSYTVFANGNLPNKDLLEEKTIGEWKSCGFCKSNELIHVNYDLENEWPNFKTIDKFDFASFYYQCCINLVAVIEHIGKVDKGLNGQKLSNELAQKFNVGPKSGNCFLNTDIDFNDLVMIDQPPSFQRYSEQDLPNFLQSAINSLRTFFQINKESKRLYIQEEFDTIIIQYIQSRAALNSKLDIIFNQDNFIKCISKLVDDFLISKTGLMFEKTNFDLDLIQLLIFKIDGLFDDYNNDFKVLGLGLSQEAISLAHNIAFRKLLDFFTAKLKSEAFFAHNLWVAKRDELLQFFVSQLVPDQSKDEENAKQFISKCADWIVQAVRRMIRMFFPAQQNKIEREFCRIRFQVKQDASMESMSREDLLEYILDPNKLILNDFSSEWSDFVDSSYDHLKQTKYYEEFAKHCKLFDELKIILTRIKDKMASLKSTSETFNVQNLFQTFQLLPDSDEQINKGAYLKVS